MITKRSATPRGYRSRGTARSCPVTDLNAPTTTVEQVVPRSVLTRATDAVANRLDRRSFIARSALVGSALVTAPSDLLLRPTSAYAAVCSCLGKACTCGSLCCDGYTEFCCAIYGANACPTGSITGGWWKADGSSFCGGAARYYMDCHKPCGGCACGGGGICSGSCNGTPCGCGNGRCDHRKAGCTAFRYGNCNNHIACIGPIQCRVVTCTAPWKIEPTCSASAVRTDNNTRNHNRACLQAPPPLPAWPGVWPVAGDWDGVGKHGIGWYDNRNGRWTLRQSANLNPVPTFTYGREPGDIPVVGDWDGNGTSGVGIFRDGAWHLSNQVGPARTYVVTPSWAVENWDLPVVGDWNGDGRQSLGIFRRGGYWYLSNNVEVPVAEKVVRYGMMTGDRPVVGDWDGDGVDGIGIFRNGTWHLNNALEEGATARTIAWGTKGDVPVVGDWHGLGHVSIGVYRPTDGKWYLRRTLDDPSAISVTWGEKWRVT
jgi:hypothetical protein